MKKLKKQKKGGRQETIQKDTGGRRGGAGGGRSLPTCPPIQAYKLIINKFSNIYD